MDMPCGKRRLPDVCPRARAPVRSPPAKDAPPTADNLAKLDGWLAALIAFREPNQDPWHFYDAIDHYLGPWGLDGYPIAYGKKYCQRFWSHAPLQASAAGRAWVCRTLVLLQLELKQFIVERFRQGNLAELTAPELKRAAFISHPRAYTEGGLAMLFMLSPLLVGHIVAIPGVEFVPWSPDFDLTVWQAATTSLLLVRGCLSSGRWRSWQRTHAAASDLQSSAWAAVTSGLLTRVPRIRRSRSLGSFGEITT
ncbi:MAG: hypothetical protein RLZZ450_2404 [Pseudomonadota bacterium]|jgi:hypothetical protein